MYDTAIMYTFLQQWILLSNGMFWFNIFVLKIDYFIIDFLTHKYKTDTIFKIDIFK